MSLIKWHPMDYFFDQMDDFISSDRPHRSLSRTFAPAINISQTDDAIIAESPLPGVDPEKINITIENDVLIIEGQEEKTSEVEEKDYTRKEWMMQSFHRSVALPTSVQSDKAVAEYVGGVLKITVPKREEAKAKKVSVKVKK